MKLNIPKPIEIAAKIHLFSYSLTHSFHLLSYCIVYCLLNHAHIAYVISEDELSLDLKELFETKDVCWQEKGNQESKGKNVIN